MLWVVSVGTLGWDLLWCCSGNSFSSSSLPGYQIPYSICVLSQRMLLLLPWRVPLVPHVKSQQGSWVQKWGRSRWDGMLQSFADWTEMQIEVMNKLSLLLFVWIVGLCGGVWFLYFRDIFRPGETRREKTVLPEGNEERQPSTTGKSDDIKLMKNRQKISSILKEFRKNNIYEEQYNQEVGHANCSEEQICAAAIWRQNQPVLTVSTS